MVHSVLVVAMSWFSLCNIERPILSVWRRPQPSLLKLRKLVSYPTAAEHLGPLQTAMF